MLTAEFPPTSGDATLAGYSVSMEPEKTRRRIGYVREHLFSLLTEKFFFTIQETLTFPIPSIPVIARNLTRCMSI